MRIEGNGPMSIIDVAINDSKEIQSALRSLTIFDTPKKATTKTRVQHRIRQKIEKHLNAPAKHLALDQPKQDFNPSSKLVTLYCQSP